MVKIDSFGEIVTDTENKPPEGFINEKGEFVRGKSVEKSDKKSEKKEELPVHLL